MSKVTLDGTEQLAANLNKLRKNMSKGVADAMLTGGKLIETQAKQLIAARSIGERVTRYRNAEGQNVKPYPHVASNPGDAPNTDTGRLIGSIQTELLTDGVYVGTSVEYAPYLEFGTSQMDARPFLFPALQTKRPAIRKLIIKQLQAAINDSTT